MAASPIRAMCLPALLGDSSCSMHLVHAFVVSAIGHVDERFGLFASTGAAIAALTLGYVASAIAGVAAWKAIERPTNEALRRHFVSRRTRAPVAAPTPSGDPPTPAVRPVAAARRGSALFTSVR